MRHLAFPTIPTIATHPRLGRRSGGAPALTGTLDLDPVTGEGSYISSVAARHYWSLTPSGVNPTADEIEAGTGAVDFGFFDATAGSVLADITFDAGINETAAVFSVAARVEPSGPWSNVLRDSSVDVNTALPLTASFIDVMSVASGTNQTYDFGTLSAGWYMAIVSKRGGSTADISQITPPSQSAVTTEFLDTANVNTNTAAMQIKAYLVELTATRSGNWTVTGVGAGLTMALYSLSEEPQLIDSDVSFGNNTAITYAFTQTVAVDDVLIAFVCGNPATISGAEDGTDAVTQDEAGNAMANHHFRAASGVAPSAGSVLVFREVCGNFSWTAAIAM